MNEWKQIYRATSRGFVPANSHAQDYLAKIPPGTLVELKGSRPRNLACSRKYFQMLHRIGEAAGYSDEDFLILVKVGLNHFEWIEGPGGEYYRKLHSISINKMAEDEFNLFYQRTITFIAETLLPMMDLQYLFDEVLDFA